MRQYRGCSKLYYAPYQYDAETNKVTFGTLKKFGDVKSISIELAAESEEVWADNKLDDITYGGASATRTFGCTRIDPAVVAEVLGKTTITVGGKTLFGNAPDASARKYFAFVYLLHDGDVNKPCEVVTAFRGMVNSISQTANTIDRGTASEGQEVSVTFAAPDVPWAKTGKADLDISEAFDSKTVTLEEVNKWYAQVVTYDNAETVLA